VCYVHHLTLPSLTRRAPPSPPLCGGEGNFFPSESALARLRCDHSVDPRVVAADRAQLQAHLGLAHDAGADEGEIFIRPVAVGDDFEPDAVGIEEIEGIDRGRNDQQRPGDDRNAVRLQPLEHLRVAFRPADEGDVLHRAERVAVGLGDALRIFEKGEKAVAAHIEKEMGDLRIGWRAVAMRAAAVGQARWRAHPVCQPHAEHAHIEIERSAHVAGVEREMVNAAQQRLRVRMRRVSCWHVETRIHAHPPGLTRPASHARRAAAIRAAAERARNPRQIRDGRLGSMGWRASLPQVRTKRSNEGGNRMKRLAWLSPIIAAAMVGIATPASAEELVLKFATLDVPQAHLNVRVHHPWAAKINQQAKGIFRIDVFDGEALANHGNVYNQVVSNVVQIAWGLPSLAGKFPLLDVTALPYVTQGDSEVASTALWRLYKTGLLDKEFDQVVPLKLIVFPQSGLQFRKEPRSLESLSGLKIIAGSKIASEIVQRLGGAPLSFRVDEYYETLQRGTADGVLVGWTAFNPFKLAEVTHYHLEVPLGGQTGYIFMAKKEWDALPEPVRK